MPPRRLVLICTVLSVLLHILVLVLAYRFPSASPRPEEVMVVDLADIPRTTDFLPPRPGILEGRKARPARPPAPSREKKPELPPERILEGRVPDLPVKPDLPPEKTFPPQRPKQEPPPEARVSNAAPGGKEGPAGQATGGGPGEPPAERAPAAPAGKGAGTPGPSRALRDLTPSLGKMVMARQEPGGRGEGSTAGSAVGTGGKPSGSEGITEEAGGGFRLTPLNAPEIQYISYFASIKRKIELVWQYPYEAAVAGIGGELTVDFVIARSGKLESVSLVRGSGSRLLDDEAIRSIRTAAPFDPIPAEYKIPSLQIRGRFLYVHGGALRIR
jgi:protein TonB